VHSEHGCKRLQRKTALAIQHALHTYDRGLRVVEALVLYEILQFCSELSAVTSLDLTWGTLVQMEESVPCEEELLHSSWRRFKQRWKTRQLRQLHLPDISNHCLTLNTMH